MASLFCKTLNTPALAQFSRNVATSPSHGALVAFKLADIGEGIREVTMKEWFVKEGDRVAQFDEICEVQSDKSSATITSRFDGVIKKLHYKIDDLALVGTPLVDIETVEAEGPFDQAPAQKVTESVAPPENVDGKTDIRLNEGILSIPSVRRLAKEHKLNLALVTGTGKQGRILKEDILNFLNLNKGKKPDLSEIAQNVNNVEDRTEPIKGFYKAMVRTMTESLKIPHFVYSDDIRVTELEKLRELLKSKPETSDLKMSILPFLIKATVNGLKQIPILNASLDENCENVKYRSAINIGVAMDTKLGLAVPVIKNADKLTILEINQELKRLMESGKKGNFSLNDLSEGTFTISNIGMIGGTYFKPVILVPQVAIIAFGSVQRLPRFDKDDNVVAEKIVNISGAADHRIIDGATMARFTQILKKQIENPYLLFLNL